MDKPERVEVGQWRAWYIHDGGAPFRVTKGMLSDAARLADHSLYLGSGDHHEPSEWMIETLVDAMSEIENGGPAFDEPSRGRFDRTNYRKIVRDAIDGKSHVLVYTRCVGVIYRLLRSLGKW